VLSSLGGLLTFYLHVVFKGDTDLLPVFLFGAVNITYISFLLVVDKEGYSRVYFVQVCLIVNAVLYLMIFANTFMTFPLDNKEVSNTTLLGVTHFCNAVAILHTWFMDGFLWVRGWEKAISELESFP
jgi:hypothetical protein